MVEEYLLIEYSISEVSDNLLVRVRGETNKQIWKMQACAIERLVSRLKNFVLTINGRKISKELIPGYKRF